MQVDLQKILSVSGHSGLFKYLIQARQGIIVESLIDGKRSCLPSSAKISSLSDITVYTENDDMLLKDIFIKMKEKHNGQQSGLSGKSDNKDLISYFGELIPEYDKSRVLPSHMRKMVYWYNLLQSKDLLDFISEKDENSETPEVE